MLSAAALHCGQVLPRRRVSVSEDLDGRETLDVVRLGQFGVLTTCRIYLREGNGSVCEDFCRLCPLGLEALAVRAPGRIKLDRDERVGTHGRLPRLRVKANHGTGGRSIGTSDDDECTC